MTELETAVEWLRDMRRIAGPHSDYATTLLDRLYDAELAHEAIEAIEDAACLDYLSDVSVLQRVQDLATYHEEVEAALERAGVLDPDIPYDVTELLAMFLPDSA